MQFDIGGYDRAELRWPKPAAGGKPDVATAVALRPPEN
jgi:hypothetical protein